jgi:isoleucyl-tRNA synthetase
MYLQLRTEGMPESIHLNSLPYDINDLSGAEDKIDQNLEEKMAKAREVVALALAKRAKSGIKVRQPLKELIITDSDLKKEKELLDLIKEEVNVKKIGFGKEIKLDAEISSELKEEGMVREIIRNIQELRKKTGLKPEHIISIGYSADFDLARILEKNKKTILKQTKAKDLIEKEKQEQIFDAEKITKVDAKEIKLFIKKIN